MSDIENAIDEAYLEISNISLRLDNMMEQVKDVADGKDLAACVSVFAGSIRDVHGCNDEVANILAVAIFKLAGLVW